jgi:hypothetical protein
MGAMSGVEQLYVSFEELQAISGKRRSSAVERWLKREHICFKRDGFLKPWTTVAALHSAIYGLKRGVAMDEPNHDVFKRKTGAA